MKPQLLFLLYFLPFYSVAQWHQLADFPSNLRDDGTGFVIGDKAYCGTGLAAWWAPFGDFNSFDTNTETWSIISALPTGEERQYAVGFSWGSHGYIFGGIGSSYLNDLWSYDTLTNVWTENSSPAPFSGRSGSSVFVIGHLAFIIGGKDTSANSLDEVWEYDITQNTWRQRNDLPFGGNWRGAATSVLNKGYLIFGADSNGTHNQLYEYDPTQDSWTLISTFNHPGRTYSSLNAIGNKLFVAFGQDSSGNFYNDLHKYDIQTSTWSTLNSLPDSARKGGISFTHGQSLYYTTGLLQSDNRTNQTWKYNIINSVSELNKTKEISVYPNPLEGNNQILVSVNDDFTFRLLDTNGKEISSGNLYRGENLIDFSAFQAGIYFLRCTTSEHSSSVKIINLNR